MRYQQALFLPVLFGVLLGGCRKDPANEAPRITIITPAENASITIPDTVVVTVEASDDQGLSGISVSLLDQNNIPVVDAVSASASGTSATITLALPISSEQLTSGTYKLFATVSDGSLSGKDVQSLHVTAVPLRVRAVFTLSVPGSGIVALYRTDSTGQTSLSTTWPTDLGGAAISSAAQRLFIAGGSSGDLRAYHPDGLNIAWQRPNLSSIGAPWFTSVDLCADGRLYVGYDDGTLRGFTPSNGTGGFTATLPAQFRTEQAITTGDLVVCTERNFVTQEQRLSMYYQLSGAMQETQPLNLTPVRAFIRGTDHALIFGNRDGSGRALERTLSGGGTWEAYTWTSPITAVEQVAFNTWVVALANGDLQRFTYGGTGSLSIATTPVLNTLAYDAVNGWVYGGADGQVLAIDPGTGTIAGGWTVNGEVRYVLPLLNR
ncbi:MAG: hypothetical protein K8H89_05425 [Flavobacteriales bacterium]|jgi:outer membrane protein assembly factor BamB|nr:hypothetical protein [Flavobacteriales bacterium]MCB0758985.1 hypothetical protein [Flavobacteriales bacterium]